MAFTTERPNADGWYWAKHKNHGKVVVHLILADVGDGRGLTWYVKDQGFGGWNRLVDQFTHWNHDPIPVPED